ncbi:hypothetical protein AYI69_g8200 [Smittium culicis]|uniref:DUF1343 domain-containing protein n=1 Tax=Smittium culicis TaxID=133412 RepID=A0A1R1XLA7_9FUNG|nr:hypothetical protein AYI69_g8200 [Smittium culicis]
MFFLRRNKTMKFSFSVLAASLLSLTYGYIPINNKVKIGFETWEETFSSPDFNKDTKYALIVNPTSVTRNLQLIADNLVESKKINLVALAGPEHGIRGSLQDGVTVGNLSFVDRVTGLQVYDGYLYTKGSQWSAAFNDMGADTIVFDIQDVGTRFYTYISAMYDAMIGAVLSNKKFIVLDRPNPINGVTVDGDVMVPQFSGYIGRTAIATQHGMTVGELAMLFNNEFLPNDAQLANSQVKTVDLQVFKMEGWKREMYYDETGLNWIIPSPNMPSLETAGVYPGQGFFEGTKLSEGRGSSYPFFAFAADYLQGKNLAKLQKAMNDLNLPGVVFSQIYFKPARSKYINVQSGGLKLYVTDRSTYKSIPTAIALLSTIKKMFPSNFEYASTLALQYRTGTNSIYEMLNSDADYQDIIAEYQSRLEQFKVMRAKYLLY